MQAAGQSSQVAIGTRLAAIDVDDQIPETYRLLFSRAANRVPIQRRTRSGKALTEITQTLSTRIVKVLLQVRPKRLAFSQRQTVVELFRRSSEIVAAQARKHVESFW